jgi:hypothetical protein
MIGLRIVVRLRFEQREWQKIWGYWREREGKRKCGRWNVVSDQKLHSIANLLRPSWVGGYSEQYATPQG